MLFTKTQIAKFAGVGTSAVSKWVNRKGLKQNDDGQIETEDFLEWWIAYKGADPKVIDLNRERALLARSQRHKVNLDVATLEGQRMPSDIVVELCQQLGNIVKAKVRGIPSQAKTKIPKLTKYDVTKLETICKRALVDVADHGIPGSLKSMMSNNYRKLESNKEKSKT